MTKTQQGILSQISAYGWTVAINNHELSATKQLVSMGIVITKKLPNASAWQVMFKNHRFQRDE